MKEFGVKEDSVRLYDETVVQLPMEQLRKVREREGERDSAGHLHNYRDYSLKQLMIIILSLLIQKKRKST